MTDLRKLLEAATKGPWHVDDYQTAIITGADHTVVAEVPGSGASVIADMNLIVAAVNALPDLLTIVEAAKTWQSTWEAVNGPHGINDVRRYSEAKAALTAALAQWEKR